MDYVGLRWYKCDFHLHTMSSKCYEDDDTVEVWVDEVERKGLKCIAVTDHDDYRYIDSIKEEAEKRGIVAFPGVELTCGESAKFHVLILFDVNRNGDDVRDFLSRVGVNKRAVENHEISSESIHVVCEKAKEEGCVVIPAHIDDKNGIYQMSDANIRGFLNSHLIDAVQVVYPDVWDNKQEDYIKLMREKISNQSISEDTIKERRSAYFKAKEADIPFIMSSDNPKEENSPKHGLWGIGKEYTWIKMGEHPNLESLRQAFLSYKERVRTSYESEYIPERVPDYWIKSINVNGATINPYSDVKAVFNTQLNTIIGGRGSGKSSIVRLIAGVLRSARFDNLKDIKEEQDSFYQVVDKKGKGIFNEKSCVTAEVYRNGSLYKITEKDFKKKVPTHTIMKYNDETRDWDLIEEEQFIDFLAVDTYTQKQIYELAQTPDALSKLIDKDNKDLLELRNSADNSHEKLIDKIKELRIIENKIKEESRLLLELKDINEQIDVFKKSGITGAIEEKTRYESEKKDIDLYINGIKNLGDEIIEWTNKEHVSSPRDDLSDDIKAILLKSKQEVESTILDIKRAGEVILNRYVTLKNDVENCAWNIDYQNSLANYENAKNTLEKQQLEPTKLDELLGKQKNKEQEIKEISILKDKIKEIKKDIASLEVDYNTELKKIRKCREEFISSILSDNHDVKIEY